MLMLRPSRLASGSIEQLQDLDLLVLDGLRQKPHPTHLSVDQALACIEKLQPRQAFLTHIAHDIAHAQVEPELPAGVSLAYDGLCVELRG